MNIRDLKQHFHLGIHYKPPKKTIKNSNFSKVYRVSYYR